MIKMQVIGYLGRDAVTNNVNGKTVINFAVAHSEKYKDATGNMIDKTVWVDCAYWTDKTAVAPYLKKGVQVHVDGMPDVRSYTTNDGRNGVTLTCKVMSLQLLGSRQDGLAGGDMQQNAAPQNFAPQTPTPSMPSSSNDVDDLPF